MSLILPKRPGLFRYSWWDAVPALFSVLHAGYLVGMYLIFARVHVAWTLKAPLLLVMGIVYAFSISWNINGISHNFIHNRYFNSSVLNRLFSLLESFDCQFSQVIYDYVHRRHHIGNSDKPDEDHTTIDWLSIYQHGHEGHAENLWRYTFGSFFRDKPMVAYHEIKKNNPRQANWGLVEMGMTGACMIGMLFLNWRFLAYFIPFWYLGHCLSYLNGYFEHFGGNPDVPMAWGVSSYHRLYNLVWFNNGYHAEHHYRPRCHWTNMKSLKAQIGEEQQRVGVRVIKPPHAFGFLDKDLCDEPLVPVSAIRSESQTIEAPAGPGALVEVGSDALGG
jgi:fatty acid desaturase